MGVKRVAVDGKDGGNGGVTDGHVGLSQSQHGLSTKVVDKEDSRDGENKVDDTDDTSREDGNGAAGQANLLEDSGSVVDDRVDTGPLLQTLGGGTEHESVEQRLGGEESLVLEQADSEGDLVHTVSLLGGLSLDKSLGLESSELVLDRGVFGPVAPEVGESLEALLFSTCSSVA